MSYHFKWSIKKTPAHFKAFLKNIYRILIFTYKSACSATANLAICWGKYNPIDRGYAYSALPKTLSVKRVNVITQWWGTFLLLIYRVPIPTLWDQKIIHWEYFSVVSIITFSSPKIATSNNIPAAPILQSHCDSDYAAWIDGVYCIDNIAKHTFSTTQLPIPIFALIPHRFLFRGQIKELQMVSNASISFRLYKIIMSSG